MDSPGWFQDAGLDSSSQEATFPCVQADPWMAGHNREGKRYDSHERRAHKDLPCPCHRWTTSAPSPAHRPRARSSLLLKRLGPTPNYNPAEPYSTQASYGLLDSWALIAFPTATICVRGARSPHSPSSKISARRARWMSLKTRGDTYWDPGISWVSPRAGSLTNPSPRRSGGVKWARSQKWPSPLT